jgi:hypothetical protein
MLNTIVKKMGNMNEDMNDCSRDTETIRNSQREMLEINPK